MTKEQSKGELHSLRDAQLGELAYELSNPKRIDPTKEDNTPVQEHLREIHTQTWINPESATKKRDYQENHLKIMSFFQREPTSTVKDCSEKLTLTERTIYNHLHNARRDTK